MKICTIWRWSILLILLEFITPVHVLAVDFKITKGTEKTLQVNVEGFYYPTELTPLVVEGTNGNRIYILGTSHSLKCISNQNLLTENVSIPQNQCTLVSKEGILDHLLMNGGNGGAIYKNPQDVGPEIWKFGYNGIMGVANITVNGQKRWITIQHNEQTNAKLGEYRYQNRLYPWITIDDKWSAFANFTSLSWYPDDGDGWQSQEPMNEYGPILWPKNGYLIRNGSSITKAQPAGFYQPTLFSDNSYLYTFVQYTGAENTAQFYPKAWACMIGARSPIASGGSPGSWKFYYQGDFNSPAMPSGYTATNLPDLNNNQSTFYFQAGGRADCLPMEGQQITHNPFYFNVAKIKGTSYYIAAEEGAIYKTPQSTGLDGWTMGVRLSKDLVHWSPIQILAQADGSWGNGEYGYPTFLNKEATTNYEIDPEEFYILGKHATGEAAGYGLKAMKLNLTAIPPTEKAESIIQQYSREFLGHEVTDINTHKNFILSNGCVAEAQNFLTSAEFLNKNMSDDQLVETLYKAVLSRNVDGPSKTFWLNRINTLGKQEAIVEFLASAGFKEACWNGTTVTPPLLLGDLNTDGKINLFDYNELVSKWNKPYANLDYQNILTNFGK